MREFFNTTAKAKHTSLNILKFVKNIFLLNTYLKYETSHNKEAGRLFNNNYEEFKANAKKCVEDSIS
jgi:ubiquitin-protein ligase